MDQSFGMLAVLAITIIMIIVLSIKFRIHAFVSLLGACFFIAFATGMPPLNQHPIQTYHPLVSLSLPFYSPFC